VDQVPRRGPPYRPGRAILSAVGQRRRSQPIGLAQMRPEHLFALVVVIPGRAFPPEFPVGSANRGLPDDPDPLVMGLPAGFPWSRLRAPSFP